MFPTANPSRGPLLAAIRVEVRCFSGAAMEQPGKRNAELGYDASSPGELDHQQIPGGALYSVISPAMTAMTQVHRRLHSAPRAS